MNNVSGAGVLYVVATPIGNLDDITARAISVLAKVDVIAAEDTRHSKRLLEHFGINTPMLSLHDYNEKSRSDSLLGKLGQGMSIALISDAGTPLISDPGYHLVHETRLQGFSVVPVPGVSALTAALSVAGLPTDRFTFEGFLPAKAGNRVKALESLKEESRTLVFYEAPHRILECLQNMRDVFSGSRQAVVARELTKQFETVYSATLEELVETIKSHPDHQRGEFVVMVQGAEKQVLEISADTRQMLVLLMAELPLKKAAVITSQLTGHGRNQLYELGLELKQQ